jgi:hypothetical protein
VGRQPFTEPVIQYLIAMGRPDARAYLGVIWSTIGLLTPMFVFYCVLQLVEEIRQIPAGRQHARNARAYEKRLKADLARPLTEIRKERAQLNPSHAMDGDFWRPFAQTTYLDGIIGVRTWPDANMARRVYPAQWKALDELNRAEARQTARGRRAQAFGRFVRHLVNWLINGKKLRQWPTPPKP